MGGVCNGDKKLGKKLEVKLDLTRVAELAKTTPSHLSGIQLSAGQKPAMTWSIQKAVTKYDESVLKYSHFNFVLSLENTLNQVGYITEKVMDSLLAGAIPIYAGSAQAPE